MFWDIVYKAGRVIGPVLVHFLVQNLIGMTGLHADAAFVASATAVLLLPLFLWLYRQDRAVSGGEKKRIGPAACLLIAAGGVCCNAALTAALNWLMWKTGIQLSNTVQESLFASSLAMQAVGIGVFVPAMEEVLFRGLVYNRLRGYTKTVWMAALLSAALFAAYHGNWLQILFAFPMGVILALVYHRWGTLKAPVIFHMAVNLSSILMTAML